MHAIVEWIWRWIYQVIYECDMRTHHLTASNRLSLSRSIRMCVCAFCGYAANVRSAKCSLVPYCVFCRYGDPNQRYEYQNIIPSLFNQKKKHCNAVARILSYTNVSNSNIIVGFNIVCIPRIECWRISTSISLVQFTNWIHTFSCTLTVNNNNHTERGTSILRHSLNLKLNRNQR